jgi:hypothetical protein
MHSQTDFIYELYNGLTFTYIALSLIFFILFTAYFIGLMSQFKESHIYLLLMVISISTIYYTLKKDVLLPLSLFGAFLLTVLNESFLSDLTTVFNNVFLYVNKLEYNNFVVYLTSLYNSNNFEFLIAVIVAILTVFYYIQYLKKNGFLLYSSQGDAYKYLSGFTSIYLLFTEIIFLFNHLLLNKRLEFKINRNIISNNILYYKLYLIPYFGYL